MPIPAGVETVTVTDGGVPLTGPDGALKEGYFTVTGPDLATVRADDFLFGGLARRWVTAGRFDPLTLVATDATGIDPAGFTYAVVFTPKHGASWTRYFTLPKAAPSVVLADILIPDPVAGAYATLVDASSLGNAATRNVGTTAGTVAAGDDSRFGSGGTRIVTADVRITAGDVALATAASWTIVTSGATQLKCAVNAAVGDRIHISSWFMRSGSSAFLDLATLTSAGAISRYAGSGTSTPLPEGNPSFYPQSSSFPGAPGTTQMIVASGEVDGSGKASVALVYKGPGPETIYASATYPFYLLLTNFGPV